ncbi:MAG TPA: hypothetical protein VFC63_05200 [Blastocatellia bacterium]|nr:hypothetical protein [Blastocatellia bacterium]
MKRIIVYVSGGMVQDVVSDSEGIEVMVVDYDVEKDCGVVEREFETVRKDRQQFGRTLDMIEELGD